MGTLTLSSVQIAGGATYCSDNAYEYLPFGSRCGNKKLADLISKVSAVTDGILFTGVCARTKAVLAISVTNTKAGNNFLQETFFCLMDDKKCVNAFYPPGIITGRSPL